LIPLAPAYDITPGISFRYWFGLAKKIRAAPELQKPRGTPPSLLYDFLFLVFVVLQANLQLANGFVGDPDSLDAVSAEVMCRVFHMGFGAAQGLDRFPDLRVRFLRVCRRGVGVAGGRGNGLVSGGMGCRRGRCKEREG